jgi:hypothetical protein
MASEGWRILGGRANDQLKPGDQFAKVEDPLTIWTVRRVVDLADLPPHAEMVSKGPKPRKVLVSSVVLHDRRLYRVVKASEAAAFGQRGGSAPGRRGWRSLLGF